jgi:hypothetical protein
MIYTAPCIMFWMRALLGQVGGGWTLEFESFLGPVKWHRADRSVPFWAQKTRCIIPFFLDPCTPRKGCLRPSSQHESSA